MEANRSRAVAALIAAGLLWGTTVPLSKVALAWLPPAWLTFARFSVACVILLVASRSGLRAALRPQVLASGALGYGGSVLLQNAGITMTSVSHAALLIGAVPVLVAIIAAVWHRARVRPLAWAGFAASLAGVGLVTAARAGATAGGGASVAGDGLVLASVALSAVLVVAQPRLLRGRDPVAVTSVQFLGAAVGVLPVAACSGGIPAADPGGLGAVLATLALVVAGTLAPFTLFAYGQKRVPAEVAGAFVNIEPVVGAVAGVIVFGDPAGVSQLIGGLAILAGIGMSSWRALGEEQAGAAGHAVREPAGMRPHEHPAGAGRARIRRPGQRRRGATLARTRRHRRQLRGNQDRRDRPRSSIGVWSASSSSMTRPPTPRPSTGTTAQSAAVAGAAGQDGGDGRRHLGGTAGLRARRRRQPVGGANPAEREFAAYDVPLVAPGRAVRELDEACQVIKRMSPRTSRSTSTARPCACAAPSASPSRCSGRIRRS